MAMAEDIEARLLDLTRVCAALPPGWRLDYHRTVGSTMDIAREAALAGAQEGYIVLAEEQTAGRGRQGRAWRSVPGANLSFTIVLRPDLAAAGRLAMLVPLAVAEGVERATSLQPAIKWPNDLQINGRKVCGVLIDLDTVGDRPAFALVGIGLNVNHDPSDAPELRDIATSLSTAAGRPLDREAVLIAVLERLHTLLAEARAGIDVRPRWRARLAMLGKEVTIRSGETVERGIAEDVDADGSLVLLRSDGTRVTFAAGEVSLRA